MNALFDVVLFRVDTIESRRSLNGCRVVDVMVSLLWKKKEERERLCDYVIREREKRRD